MLAMRHPVECRYDYIMQAILKPGTDVDYNAADGTAVLTIMV